MAADDDQRDGLDDGEGGGDKKSGGGALPEFVILILKIVAGGLGALLLSITVSVITFNIMKGDQPSQSLVDASPNYAAKPPTLSFTLETDMSGQTSDGKSVMIKMQMGYLAEGAQATSLVAEINNNMPRFRDMVRRMIGQLTQDDLRDEERLKERIKTRVNDILSTGQIREVVFTSLSVFNQ